MIKLRKLISDDQKVIRHRHLYLTIQVTILIWIVEAISSLTALLFALVVMGAQSTSQVFVKELVLFVYTVVLPGIVVVYDTELKENILENSLYIGIVNKLGLTYKGPRRQNAFEATTQPTEPRTSEESESSHVEEKVRFEVQGVLSDFSSYANEKQPKENSIDLIMKNAENGCPLGGKDCHKIARHSRDCELIELE